MLKYIILRPIFEYMFFFSSSNIDTKISIQLYTRAHRKGIKPKQNRQKESIFTYLFAFLSFF